MTIEEIQELDFEQALRLIRFTPLGSDLFTQGTELHQAMADRWSYLSSITPIEEQAKISKKIGWDQ